MQFGNLVLSIWVMLKNHNSSPVIISFKEFGSSQLQFRSFWHIITDWPLSSSINNFDTTFAHTFFYSRYHFMHNRFTKFKCSDIIHTLAICGQSSIDFSVSSFFFFNFLLSKIDLSMDRPKYAIFFHKTVYFTQKFLINLYLIHINTSIHFMGFICGLPWFK